MAKRRPRRKRNPNLRRIRSVAFVIAVQALRRAGSQIGNMPMPAGVDSREVSLEFSKLVDGLQARLNRIAGAPKGEVVG